MHHLRSTRAFIGGITVGLQNAFKLAKKVLRTFTPAAQSKVKQHAASGPAVLPQVSLMIFPAPIMHLHRNRRFIGLNVAAGE